MMNNEVIIFPLLNSGASSEFDGQICNLDDGPGLRDGEQIMNESGSAQKVYLLGIFC